MFTNLIEDSPSPESPKNIEFSVLKNVSFSRRKAKNRAQKRRKTRT